MANNRFNVFDMPVYGSNVTISGLTLRQGADGSEVEQCSAFIPAISGDGVIAAKASFTGEVSGNIIFVSCVCVVMCSSKCCNAISWLYNLPLSQKQHKMVAPSLLAKAMTALIPPPSLHFLVPHTSRFSATIAMVLWVIPAHRYTWTSTILQ